VGRAQCGPWQVLVIAPVSSSSPSRRWPRVVSGPITTLALGPSSNTGAISDAKRQSGDSGRLRLQRVGLDLRGRASRSPFIQLLPSQRSVNGHRLTQVGGYLARSTASA
jgi:hypothetical protein